MNFIKTLHEQNQSETLSEPAIVKENTTTN